MVAESGSFAERLRTAREGAGLTQYALAKRSRVSKQALSKLEMGEREPSWATVQRLAAALGLECTAFKDPALAESVTDEPPRPRGRPRKDASTPAATHSAPPAAELQDQAAAKRGKATSGEKRPRGRKPEAK